MNIKQNDPNNIWYKVVIIVIDKIRIIVID